MDKEEAKSLLASELQKYRDRSYESLCSLLHNIDTYEIEAQSGVLYQLEIQAMWDNKPDGDLRIVAGIDDGGLRAYFPLTDSFILSPDGKFVDE